MRLVSFRTKTLCNLQIKHILFFLSCQEAKRIFLVKAILHKITLIDDFVKSRNQTAKKKDPDARRANPEE